MSHWHISLSPPKSNTSQEQNKTKLTIDHVIPKSKGGSNSWQNLVTCCKSCNIKKDNKTLEEVGQILSVTRNRIRQIEAKALRKMKHPSRSEILKKVA